MKVVAGNFESAAAQAVVLLDTLGNSRNEHALVLKRINLRAALLAWAV